MKTLADELMAATYQPNAGINFFVQDRHAFREVLKKAHCFKLDDATSALVPAFSYAIASDIDSARQLAVPPYPVTFFEINQKIRLCAARELGAKLTRRAAGQTEEGEAVDRIGWLIDRHPSQHTSYRMTYCCVTDQGILIAPLSYWWDVEGNSCPWESSKTVIKGQDCTIDEARNYLIFGIGYGHGKTVCANVDLVYLPGGTELARLDRKNLADLITEIAGELRSVFGLLIAMNGAARTTVETGEPTKADIKEPLPNGKPQFALVHKTLVVHLGKNNTPEKVASRLLSGVKKKRHEVMGHWRNLRNADGSLRKRVAVRSHERGDERLGRIVKTYEIRK